MLLTNRVSNTMLSPLFLASPSLLGVFLPFGLVPILLQLLWFFPARTQMLLLVCGKQYHPMDPHLANLGHFGLYSSFLCKVFGCWFLNRQRRSFCLSISESTTTVFAVDFWIGSDAVFTADFWLRFCCRFLIRQQLSLIKSIGSKPDCFKELRGRGKTGFGQTKIGIRIHLNQPQTRGDHFRLGSVFIKKSNQTEIFF